MAQKTYKDIEAEANRRFGKGASREKFEFRRQQQEAAGLEKESKKRGGVAGAYDRNKALVQAAAPILAGMLIPGIGSAAAGAITGGLAKGLDRPGKGGIGLDLGEAAKGAIAGAGMGQLGGAAKAKFGEFMANRAANAATQAQAAIAAGPKPSASLISGSMPPAPTTTISQAAATPSPAELGMGPLRAPRGAGAAAPAPRAAGMPPMAPARPPAGPLAPTQGFSGLGAGAAPPAPTPAPPSGGMATVRNLLTNPQVLAGATGAVADVMGQRSQQRIAEQQLAQQGEQFQQRFGMEEEELKRRQAQANRLAGLFTPTRSFANLGMGMANGNQ